MRTITLEEHFATSSFLEGPGAGLVAQARSVPSGRPGNDAGRLLQRLCDLGQGRLEEMDRAGIDVQALSLTAPGIEQLDPGPAVALARSVNDTLAEAVRAHPERLRGFATVPTPDPGAAVAEVRRAHDDLGFRGAVINGHSRGRYLDDERYWPILGELERLGMPLYLHPTYPAPQTAAVYAGNYSAAVQGALSVGGWGWHVDTCFHALRLVLSGAFDRFPRLQLVIGHLGEGLVGFLDRFESSYGALATGLEHPVEDYFRRNVHYTISGFNFEAPFLGLLLLVGAERILFSADWPYRSMEEARAFLDRLPVSPADRERIANGNAEVLYGF
ncbi:MAG: amidohydrolase [Candidatus Dormibacteraeota bacterium]|nr:amidohydrolase [Candidatus Dormibacteraeota bacterium]